MNTKLKTSKNGPPNRRASGQVTLMAANREKWEEEEHPKFQFKVHTNRGGRIQIDKSALHALEDDFNDYTDHSDEQFQRLKNTKKVKLITMIYTIFKHYIQKLYLPIIIFVIYLLRRMRAKYQVMSHVNDQLGGKFL